MIYAFISYQEYILIISLVDFNFTSYCGVVIFRLPYFPGKKVNSWSQLEDINIDFIFEIVRSFHEVHI